MPLIATDVAHSVVCVPVCLCVFGLCCRVICEKNLWTGPIEMPFGGRNHVDPRNHVLDGVEMPSMKGTLLYTVYTRTGLVSTFRIVGLPAHAADECEGRRRRSASCQISLGTSYSKALS